MNPLQPVDAVDLAAAYPTCRNAVALLEHDLATNPYVRRSLEKSRHSGKHSAASYQELFIGRLLSWSDDDCKKLPCSREQMLAELESPAFLTYLRAKLGAM